MFSMLVKQATVHDPTGTVHVATAMILLVSTLTGSSVAILYIAVAIAVAHAHLLVAAVAPGTQLLHSCRLVAPVTPTGRCWVLPHPWAGVHEAKHVLPQRSGQVERLPQLQRCPTVQLQL